MAPVNPAGLRLQHMLENIDGVLDITAGLDIDTIVESFALIRATERAVQIISEAAKELPPDVRALEPDVPWRNIIGIGNLLRHEYYKIDTSVLDAILRLELPTLRLAVIRLIGQVKAAPAAPRYPPNVSSKA